MTKYLKIVGAALIAVVIGSIYASLCYWPITGTVVDAETGKPIEGAVVLAQWTMTKGMPGLTYKKVYKITETETDQDGNFSISGVYNPLASSPVIIVYKKSFIAWRNDLVFPGSNRKASVNYKDIKLERFKTNYSLEDHHRFMSVGIIGASIERTPRYFKAESEEFRRALQEIEKNKLKN